MRDDVITLHDGRHMAFIECGDPGGLPVLCCHGAPGSRHNFDGLDALATDLHARVIAPDRPGYGGSDPRPGRRIEDWPADVLELAARLGISRLAVLGVSSGAPYTLATAARVGRDVVAAGIIAGVSDMGRPGAAEGFDASEAALMRVAQGDPAAVLEELGTQPGAEAGYAEDVIAQARPWTFEPREVHAPVLIWHGDEDDVVPLHHARHTASLLRRATLHVIPGEGHMQVISRLGELLPLLLAARR